MPNHAPLQKHPAPADKAKPPQRPRAFGGAGRGMAAPPPSSGGQPLPGAVQARMEASFGAPLGSVRVHQGAEPEAVGAQAYTRGEHIHFRPGLFQPGSSDGLRLLGHELTHVVQQRAGRVPPAGAGAAAINRDARLEREAEHAGARAARGLPALLPGIPAATPARASAAPVQRGRMLDLRGLKTREDVVGYIEENKKRFLFRAIAVAEEWNAENGDDPVEVPGGGGSPAALVKASARAEPSSKRRAVESRDEDADRPTAPVEVPHVYGSAKQTGGRASTSSTRFPPTSTPVLGEEEAMSGPAAFVPKVRGSKRRHSNSSSADVDDVPSRVTRESAEGEGDPRLPTADDPEVEAVERKDEWSDGEEEEEVPQPKQPFASRREKSRIKREKKSASKARKKQERKEKLKITNWGHIGLHFLDDPTKTHHGVFDSPNKQAVTELVTRAVKMIREKDPAVKGEKKNNYPKAYAVQMGGRIGVMGGKQTSSSHGKIATYLHVVMGSPHTVTNAFPGDTSELKH